MPPLVRLLARNALIGFFIAVVTVAALVFFDVARIGSLTASAERGWFIRGILAFMLGLTFASAQMGFAVMLMPYDAGEPPSGARRVTRRWNPAGRLSSAVRVPIEQKVH